MLSNINPHKIMKAYENGIRSERSPTWIIPSVPSIKAHETKRSEKLLSSHKHDSIGLKHRKSSIQRVLVVQESQVNSSRTYFLGLSDSSGGACCQAWPLEFNALGPHGGRKGLLPASCSEWLPYTCMHTNACTETHIHTCMCMCKTQKKMIFLQKEIMHYT